MHAAIPGLGLTEGGEDTGPNRGALFLTGLLAAIAVGVAYGVWRVPLEPRDNQHYFFIAESFARGVAPHVSAFDPKNMLGPMLTGFVIRLGDLVHVPVIWSARAESLLLSGVVAGTTALVALRLTGRRAAGALAVLAAISWSSVMYQAAVGAQPKQAVMLFVALTLLAVASQRLVLAAFCGALAFLSWQPTLLLLGILALLTLARPDRWRLAWRQTIAATIPVALYEGYFSSKGALGEQLEQAYRFPATFMTHRASPAGILLRSVRTVWYTGFGHRNVLPWIGLAAGALLVVGLVRRGAAARAWLFEHTGWSYFFLTGAALTAFTIYDHQGPPDFWLVLVHLGVMVAIACTALAERFSHAGMRRAAYAAVALALVATDIEGYRVRPHMPDTIDDQLAAAAEVRGMLDRGETVYAVNATHLLALARASNWSEFSSFFRGVNKYLPIRSGRADAWIPTRDGHLPSVILMGNGRPYGWPAWIIAHYDEGVPSAAMRRSRVAIWRLRGAA